MSIAVGTAAKQVNRLCCLRGWKDLERPAKEELASWLARACETDYQAQYAVEKWMESEQFLPAPSDLHRLAKDAPLKPETRRKFDCPLCRGEGRESYWVLRTIISRWPDTGRVRHQQIERLTPWAGRENLYLIEQPRAIRPDGSLGWLEEQITQDQTVALVSGYCGCEYGQHLRAIAAREDAA